MNPALTTARRRFARRRVLAILGAAAGLPLLAGGSMASVVRERTPVVRWRGTALGAPAEIALVHPDRTDATKMIERCVTEVRRLERIFSLYRSDSELVILNRSGRLEAPSLDMVTLLDEAREWGARTRGAFDITIQPLWRAYLAHFIRRPGGGSVPDPRAIAAALRLIDYASVEVSVRGVALAKPGMAVTLNGIAQGYITDRVAELLGDQGMSRVLVNLGESRALGSHPSNRAWRLGLRDPRAPERIWRTLDVADRAVASSGGYGTTFEPTGHYHHLLDPVTGDCAREVAGVTVIADRATTADALSTALCILPPEAGGELLRGVSGAAALCVRRDGRVARLGAWAAPGSGSVRIPAGRDGTQTA